MVDVIVDTNVIIYFVQALSYGEPLYKALKQKNITFGVSAITEIELFAKPGLGMEQRIALEECLHLFTSIEVNSHIAKISAYLLSRYKISLADATIAATAKYYDIPLWTYNLKDFKQIPNLLVSKPSN